MAEQKRNTRNSKSTKIQPVKIMDVFSRRRLNWKKQFWEL